MTKDIKTDRLSYERLKAAGVFTPQGGAHFLQHKFGVGYFLSQYGNAGRAIYILTRQGSGRWSLRIHLPGINGWQWGEVKVQISNTFLLL